MPLLSQPRAASEVRFQPRRQPAPSLPDVAPPVHARQWKHLRATFGTRLGEAGYNAFEIADLMGHSDIHTTRRHVRVMEGKKREAVRACG
jgi:integrase